MATIEDAILGLPEHVLVGTLHIRFDSLPDLLSLELRRRHSVEPPVVVAFPLIIAESLLVKQMSIVGEATQGSVG